MKGANIQNTPLKNEGKYNKVPVVWCEKREGDEGVICTLFPIFYQSGFFS